MEVCIIHCFGSCPLTFFRILVGIILNNLSRTFIGNKKFPYFIKWFAVNKLDTETLNECDPLKHYWNLAVLNIVGTQ